MTEEKKLASEIDNTEAKAAESVESAPVETGDSPVASETAHPQASNGEASSGGGDSEGADSPVESVESVVEAEDAAVEEGADSETRSASDQEQEAVAFEDLDDEFDDDFVDEDEDEDEDAAPLESMVEEGSAGGDEQDMSWYILKVQVNRENSICDALQRRVALAGLEHYFSDILVPTEDVREFTKSGKQRIVKRKLYPGYVVVRMAINDESWFLVRETPGIGDFTGAAGKPAPLTQDEIDRILQTTLPSEKEAAEENVKIGIKYKVGDRVRVKEGNFQNYEGEVSNIDERNGRVTVMINIFNRPNPVELDHWQVEEFE